MLKVWAIDNLVPRLREPVIPNGVPGAANRRNMVTLRENCISLFRNAHTAPICGKPGEVLHFCAAHVIKVARVVAVAAHAESCPAKLPGNPAQMRQKALPLRWDAGAGLARIAPP